MEARDQYFTNLRSKIEKCTRKGKGPVLLLGYSCGNKVVQYFLWSSKFPVFGRTLTFSVEKQWSRMAGQEHLWVDSSLFAMGRRT